MKFSDRENGIDPKMLKDFHEAHRVEAFAGVLERLSLNVTLLNNKSRIVDTAANESGERSTPSTR
jgi:hypothetical protein